MNNWLLGRMNAFKMVLLSLCLFQGVWAITIKVACVQMISSSNQENNATKIKNWIKTASDSGAHLAIFPEGALTDYETPGVATAAWISTKLAEIGQVCSTNAIAAVVGSDEPTGNVTYNSAFVIDYRGRLLGSYSKLHLYPGEEQNWDDRYDLPVFDLAMAPGTVRVGIQICFDQSFFETYRLMAMKGARLLLHIAAAYGTSGATMRPLMKANLASRASCNGVFAAVTNRADITQMCRAMVIDPQGRVLATTNDDSERMVVGSMDMSLATAEILAERRTAVYTLQEK
jgi:predicted amidohydrolase